MASKKDRDIEQEYTELRLRYALEDPAVRSLFEKWVERGKAHKKNVDAGKALKGEAKNEDYIMQMRAESKIHTNLFDDLLRKLRSLGIYFPTGRDMYISYCQITEAKEWNPEDVLPMLILESSKGQKRPSVWVVMKLKNKRGRKAFVAELGLRVISELFSGIHNFNRETGCFRIKYKHRDTNRKHEIIGYRWAIEDVELLQLGKYLHLQIDMKKNIASILEELVPIIQDFKKVMDKPDSKNFEIKKRRQDIDLYKRRLRVYHLVLA